ncbi:MAG: glycerophosphodiester phosphodiesterase [Alphaproteobacteria bacterium]|nr:MAG: glycerophosphodiester phosphodiesterase [Alphaproteobacteria bacterium]
MDLTWIKTRPIAHRGLHDVKKGIIENTPAAFEAAIAAGYPIELDLQLTSDHEAMVFHDDKLDRLTTSAGKLYRHSSTELRKLTISGSTATMPTFAEFLELVNGRVPILIELKNKTGVAGPLEQRTRDLLQTYKGEAAVQCFAPQSMGWFAENMPEIPRGQLSQPYPPDPNLNLNWIKRFVLRHMLLNKISKPHFVAYRIDGLSNEAVGRAKRHGLPVLAWTVKTIGERRIAATHADNIIFENFLPDATRGAAFDG